MGAKTTLQNPKGPISGAEAVVRSLVAEGADLIYGYPCLLYTSPSPRDS